ncbi:MAG TPA: acyl-CoA thioesterase [Rhodothermales bacterium]|nr:acyl-CoA thioesterase [Rhodothermales bacterium]
MQKIIFEERIHTFQIDFNRHVSNVVYVQWMEIGRLRLLEAVGLPIYEIDRAGFLPVLVETQITYKRPLYMGDTVRVELWLSELTNATALMEFKFLGGNGKLAAEGRQRGVFVNTGTGRPLRLSPQQRAAFEPYLAPE